MIRATSLITLALALSVAVPATAEPPHQPDLDACKQEAAAAGPIPATAPEEAKAGTSTERQNTAKTDDKTSAAQPPATGGDENAASAAARQAFAGCLGRHGYYKGYYH